MPYFNNKTTRAFTGFFILAGLMLPLTAIAEDNLPQSVYVSVPFTTQAPLGEWSDPRQADGCEEAGLSMAMMWVWGTSVPAEEVRRDIIEMSEYEKIFYGSFEDSSSADTAKLMQSYFRYNNVSVRENISLTDIKTALANNQLVIVPVNTRKLGNRIYAKGPVRHMVVVTGYDDQTGAVIVNDPLLKNGRSLRFKQANFANALSDYDTGRHKPVPNPRRTAMIIVNKE